MTRWLIISDHGIVGVPVQADSSADLAAVLEAETPDGVGGAIQLVTVADIADGKVPPEFLEQQANREALVVKGAQALNNNQVFLALQTPTNAQTLAQVQALTRECSATIRLLLGLLNTTVGT